MTTDQEDKAILKALKAARRLIATPRTWMKGNYSVIHYNRQRNPYRCYCAAGAVESVTKNTGLTGEVFTVLAKDHHVTAYTGKARLGLLAAPVYSVIEYNDDKLRTHEQIVRLFDRTIKRVERSLGR